MNHKDYIGRTGFERLDEYPTVFRFSQSFRGPETTYHESIICSTAGLLYAGHEVEFNIPERQGESSKTTKPSFVVGAL